MKIRTIAAAAAVALASLAAVPGVAMASTSPASTSGSGPKPVQVKCSRAVGRARGPVVQVACCARFVKRGQVRAPAGGPRISPVRALGCCPPFVVAGPLPLKHVRVKHGGPVVTPVPGPIRAIACGGQQMTFDMPAFASTATEVSGPHLTTHELMIYKQQIFLIRSVQGRTFTLTKLITPAAKPITPVRIKLGLFTNGATPITDGHADVMPGPAAVTVVGQQRR